MNKHDPEPVVVYTGEIVGGVKIETGTEVQLRCSCNIDLDWGHHVKRQEQTDGQ